MQSIQPCKRAVAFLSIIVTSVVAYLPAVDNFFISDDFGLFTVIQAAEKNPRWFFDSTTEFFRLVSYVYFAACFWLFGLSSEPFYWAGIALHAIVSILVYFLVYQTTRSFVASWGAGLFFAAYERHQEAIMWISAANDVILALNCIVFLILWRRAADSKSTVHLVSAHIMFAVALFSKEAAVVLMPLAALQLALAGYSFRAVLRKSALLVTMLGAFGIIWLAVVQRNFFVTQGHYALGWHVVPVYTRSLFRLLAQTIPLLAALILTRRRHARQGMKEAEDQTSARSPWEPATIFFAAVLVLAIVPYSFLTYLNHIPSRNTYLPSVGLAGLIGIIFASFYGRLKTDWSKRAAVVFFCAIISANVAYIWLKKEPQFRERSAPTRELIEILNARQIERSPVYVCHFPLDPWTFSEAVTRFTRFKAGEVVLAEHCDLDAGAVMQWNEATHSYITNFEDAPAGGRVTVSAQQKSAQ